MILCLVVANGVARASDSPEASLPPNLTSAAVFHPALERMLQSSATFRRQCRRLAAAPDLRIRLMLEDLSRRPSFRARSAMQFQNGSLVSVDIHVTRSGDPVELIAHELEHVIEQLDGIDLQVHASAGTAWKREDGAFETRRAVSAGRRVARDVAQEGSPQVATRLPIQPDAPGQPLGVVAQRDRFAALHDPPSGRVSADGRHVVLASGARLVPEDGNTTRDVYVFDVSTRQLTLETSGANGDSFNPDISADGRHVVFESTAGNLTDTPMPSGVRRVYVRDRRSRVTRLLSTTPGGAPANGVSMTPAISADGTTAVFTSSATNLVDDATMAGGIGVYRIDLSSNERARIDVTSAGRGHAGQSASPALSADGRYVAFASDADLSAPDEAARRVHPRDDKRTFDVYVRDVRDRRTRRVSVGASGSDADGPSYQPAISGDGRHVAFVSDASNLTSARIRSQAQIFVRDMETGTIELVSRTPSGRPGNGRSARPAVSGDGSVIAYQSLASNLRCDDRCRPEEVDINLQWDVYVHDRGARQTTRHSGDQGDEWMESSRGPSLDGAGRVLTFASRHQSSTEDAAHDEDLFIARIEAVTRVTTGRAR